jgi:hypothetical protein
VRIAGRCRMAAANADFAQFSQDSHNFRAKIYSDHLMDTAVSGFLMDALTRIVSGPCANG